MNSDVSKDIVLNPIEKETFLMIDSISDIYYDINSDLLIVFEIDQNRKHEPLIIINLDDLFLDKKNVLESSDLYRSNIKISYNNNESNGPFKLTLKVPNMAWGSENDQGYKEFCVTLEKLTGCTPEEYEYEEWVSIPELLTNVDTLMTKTKFNNKKYIYLNTEKETEGMRQMISEIKYIKETQDDIIKEVQGIIKFLKK